MRACEISEISVISGCISLALLCKASRAQTHLTNSGVTGWLPLLREVNGTPSATVDAAMKAARSLVANLFWIFVRTSPVVGKSLSRAIIAN